MWLCLAVLVRIWHVGCVATCLPDAVPNELLKNVSIDGQEMPLGIWMLDWTSAKIMGKLFWILARDKFGYETTEVGRSGTSPSALHAIAGCEDGTDYVLGVPFWLEGSAAVSSAHVASQWLSLYRERSTKLLQERSTKLLQGALLLGLCTFMTSPKPAETV